MEIKRSEIKNVVRQICEVSRDEPVFITHYGDVTNVLISKKMFDEWKAIVDKHKEEQNLKN